MNILSKIAMPNNVFYFIVQLKALFDMVVMISMESSILALIMEDNEDFIGQAFIDIFLLFP